MANTPRPGPNGTTGRGTPASGSGPLRNWAAPSYDVKTGRTASSIQEMGPGMSPGAKGNHTTAVSSQADAPQAGGQKGAPSIEGMNRYNSGDPGRRRYGASRLP